MRARYHFSSRIIFFFPLSSFLPQEFQTRPRPPRRAAGPPTNPEAIVLRRNNCGTRASSHALLAFNGGIRGAYTEQSLSSIYGQARRESLCGVRLGAGSAKRCKGDGGGGGGTWGAILPEVRVGEQQIVGPVWPLLSI